MTGIDEFSLFSGLYASIRRKCPLVVACSDHPFWSRYYAGKNPLRSLEGSLRTQILRVLLRQADQILCFIEKEVLDFLKLAPAKLTQMRNGVNDTLLSLREEGGPGVPYSIGYIGGVEELKGSLDMLEILMKIRRRGIPATLILVGPFDSKESSVVFRRKSEELGVAEAVRVTGYMPHMEGLKLLRTCTVCIHAYRPLPWLYYNQVLKLAEYMALGKAVVSWDYPGARRMLDGGRIGVLVEYGDLDRMVERVAELLTNDELRRGFEKSGYETVADRFVWSKIGQDVLEVITEVAARNGKRSSPGRIVSQPSRG
jgi:glycosyltransferase involved in cell wall biosynthesis